MGKKSIDKLSPFEFFLMQAAGENTNDLSEMSVQLIVPKQYGNTFFAMHVPETMQASELLSIIGANELTEFNTHSTHVKDNGKYRNSGELENRTVYNVHTSDPDKTAKLIIHYNHKN